MEEKPKIGGRGMSLLQKMKSRIPEQSDESKSCSGLATEQPTESFSIGVEKPLSKKSCGRAYLLNHLKVHSHQSEEKIREETCETSNTKPEGPKRGRGFLLEIAKQAKMKEEVGISRQIEMSKDSEQTVGRNPLLEKKMQEMSLKSEEIEHTENPPVIRRGEMGEKVNVFLNYVTLTTDPGKGVFEYNVCFQPEVDYATFRYKLINEHFRTKKGIRCYDGGEKLYMPEKITSDKLIIDSEHPSDKSPVQIIIKFKRQLRLTECCQLYNILLNNCSRVLKMTRLGRQYFDSRLSFQIPQHKLEIWPGYVTAVEEYEGGIHLYCDIRHRVLRTETAYDVIINIAKFDSSNFKSLTLQKLLGQCVLTRYNNNLYRIDDIDWNQTPLSTFKLKSGEDISFLEYYKNQYNLQIKDLKQPLLINKPKTKRAGENFKLICLVPELCYMTGLTDHMRRDMRVMKEISMYTKVSPAQRQLNFQKFLENLKNCPAAQEMLNEWGLRLAEEPLFTEARILPEENILLKDRSRCTVSSNAEWSKYIRNNGVFRNTTIEHWLLVHTKRDSKIAISFAEMLLKMGQGLGIQIYPPTPARIVNDRIESYINALRENITEKTQVVVCLCPTAREDRYSAIKKLCCRDIPVPSQVVNITTISNENRMRFIVQSIALQINNKIGGATWAVHIPLKNTMICGIDSYHDSIRRGYSVGAFVASLDSDFTQWYSKTCIQEPKQELVDGLLCCFAHGLKNYLKVNKTLPERIVIYRDGVGDGQLPVVLNHEITQFLETCKLVSSNYKPKFSFIVVQKRINTKLYQLSNGNSNLGNPKPGCVLDHTVTRRNFYDFFLVSQFVSCGTATPTHYIVLYDTSELKPDLMQRLTYKCCHLYYNWPGTIRVPAPCQYAHKLAFLVGQNVKELPKSILDDKLYYL